MKITGTPPTGRTIRSSSGRNSICTPNFGRRGSLTDFDILVGSREVPIKVDKLVLAAHFEYFMTMFTSEYAESISGEVHLPFVGPEDLKLILRYAYCGEVNLTKENVFKMAVLTSYFGCENLLGRCCGYIIDFIDLENCTKLVEMASLLYISKLQQRCVDFIIDNLLKVNCEVRGPESSNSYWSFLNLL